ncbi:MAG: STT3 domain-containing protein, partial [Candidatus Woesearchaeota archaeon]
MDERKEEIDLTEKRKELVKGVKNFFSSLKENKEDSEDDDLSKQRKQLIHFVKTKWNYLIYIVLAAIIWFGVKIRIGNLWLLKDSTTGKYIPMALDPHLFLKYTKYIVEHGSLLAHDPTRFVPLGTSTVQYVFMSGFIAYLYKFVHIFFPSVTIEYVDVIYPVICFAIAMVFFFLLVRRMFEWKTALISTLFLSIVPAFLYRTMGGFSDHEALGIMLMFMALYFYIVGWQSKNLKVTLIWASLAGIFTGLMGLSWGGWTFLILIISLAMLVEFFFDKIKNIDVYQYTAWLIFAVLTTTTWIPMFTLKTILGSFTTGIAFLVLFMLLVDLALFKFDLLKIKHKIKGKLPLSFASFIVSIFLGILILGVAVGPSELAVQFNEVSDNLLHPLGNDRWQLTVAEQHQPYFTDWISNFGPVWFNIPIFLTLFMLGSIILFYNLVRNVKKKYILTSVYVLFLLAFTMSRYSPSSTFNGINNLSMFTYLGSLFVFMALGVYFYLHSYYKDKSTYEQILKWDKKLIFVLIWFLIMVVAARGAARLLFIFAPITAIMAGYAVTELGDIIYRIKNKSYKIVLAVILILVLVSPFAFPAKGVIVNFSESSLNQAKYSGPGYNQQWQLAGQWARENIPEDAVFGHWWDYGYWVQSGFERAAMLDGANKIKYWNYLMGRHVLTGQTQQEALEFLKVHDVTHYLIVSDEIGKYTAYSSIGSDQDHDRYSWITTFTLNEKATQETRNATVLTYQGGYVLDDDFVWEGRVYPQGNAGIGAVFLPIKQTQEVIGNETITTMGLEQPTIALVYEGKRVDVPLKCVYYQNQMFKFPVEGYDGCFSLIPTLDGQGQMQNPMGAGLFVSEEGVKALWVNLYVFNQNNPDFDTSAFKSIYNDPYLSILALVQGRLMGPIKIWDIEYPEGFTVDAETTAK